MNQLKKADAVKWLKSVAVAEIKKEGFGCGEDTNYINYIMKVANALKHSKLPEDTDLEVSADSVALVHASGKKIKLYSIFMDSFSLYYSYGRCDEYCANHYDEFVIKLRTAESFFS